MLPATVLLLGLLPATVAGSGETSRLQLDLAPSLQIVGADEFIPVVELRAVVFLKPVRDDATPIPLQPFLQRASSLWLRLAGSARDEINTFGYGGAIEAGADLYPTGMLALRATVGADGYYNRILDGSKFPHPDIFPSPLRVAASIGVRLGDLRIDLGYRYAPGAATVPDWLFFQQLPDGAPLGDAGGVTLGVRAVLVERIDVRLGLVVSKIGVYGDFHCDYHASRRMALQWGIDFAHGPGSLTHFGAPALDGGPEFTGATFDRFGARFGLSWWWTQRLGIAGSYAVDWYYSTTTAGQNAPGQRLSLELSTRI